MALDFLADIGNFVGKLGGYVDTASKIVNPVSQIINTIKGTTGQQIDENEALRQQIINMATNFPQSDAEGKAIALRMALADPNNPLLKALTEQGVRSGTEAMQGDIRSRVLADRRERAMGRAPVFFDPERADENIAFQISRGGPGIRAAAQESALQRILQAAGVGDFASNQDKRYQGNLNALASLYTMNNQNGPRPQQSNSIEKILSAFSQSLSGLNKAVGTNTFGPHPMNQTFKNGETVRWNQMRY